MDDEIDSLVLRVRADTGAFARDVADMRRQLEGPLSDGARGAGGAIEAALGGAARTGRVGFEDLARVAVRAFSEIAGEALRSRLGLGGGGIASSGGGLLSFAAAALGVPGRATGGPVEGGRAYLVGERGPELFVPTASGRIETGGGGRTPVNITVNVSPPAGAEPGYMAMSGRQVARAVAVALEQAR
ncbi:MAG: tail tape measure protein [Sphingomonadaceae bacterium]|nr:tail tape measure protein [Sphingomonadaceae bacterium]